MLERGVGSGAAKNAIRNARLTGSRTKTESRPHFFRCLLLSQLAPLRAGTPAAAGGLALPIASTLGSTLAATDGARRVGGDVTGTADRYFNVILLGCLQSLRLLTFLAAARWRRGGCLGRRERCQHSSRHGVVLFLLLPGLSLPGLAAEPAARRHLRAVRPQPAALPLLRPVGLRMQRRAAWPRQVTRTTPRLVA